MLALGRGSGGAGAGVGFSFCVFIEEEGEAVDMVSSANGRLHQVLGTPLLLLPRPPESSEGLLLRVVSSPLFRWGADRLVTLPPVHTPKCLRVPLAWRLAILLLGPEEDARCGLEMVVSSDIAFHLWSIAVNGRMPGC